MTLISPYSQSQHAIAANDIGARALVLTTDRYSVGLLNASLLALLTHILLVVLIALMLFIFNLLGIKITAFDPAVMKQRDIEFVLVNNPTAPPRDKNTKNRADKATRSGGTVVKNQPKAEPQKAAGRPTPKPQKPRAAQPKQQVTQARPQPRPQPQPVQPAPTPAPQPSPKPAPKAPQPKVPKAPEIAQARPVAAPNPLAPNIKIPMPGNPKAVSTGPIASSSGSSGATSSGGSKGAVGPQAIPGNLSRNIASGSPGSGGRGGASGGSGGTGSYNQSGSPGGGGGRPGIDALPEPDFGPYIAELQRRIKRNWNPPSADRSKRVVALFTINRSGQLTSVRLKSSSGTQAADQAAIAAIQASAPFRNLPTNYRGNSIDVEFIFDYDVFTGKMR